MKELSHRKKLALRFLARITLISLAIYSLFLILPLLFSLFAPFLLAFLLAYSCNPLISTLEQCLGWQRKWVVLWLLSFLLLVVIALLWVILPSTLEELSNLGRNWESIFEETMVYLVELEEKIASLLHKEPSTILKTGFTQGKEAIKAVISTWVGELLTQLGQIAMALPKFSINSFVFFLSSYFIASDYPKYQKYLEKVKGVCSSQWVFLAGELKHSAITAFEGYLKAQFLLSVGVFVIVFLGFLALGIRFALVLAILIAVLDFIPMIGAGLLLLPWSGVALLTGDMNRGGALFLIWLATAVFRRIWEPKILGEQTGLSPLLSLGSIYLGLQVAGVWGMVFAPVVTLVLLNLFSLGLFQGFWHDADALLEEVKKIFQNSENK